LQALTRVVPRSRNRQPFLSANQPWPPVLLDSTVYIDQLQGRFPPGFDVKLRAANVWHSTITECELAALTGLLKPEHPGTAQIIETVLASIKQRHVHRIVNPDRNVWHEAGVLSGTLSRLQQYGKADQRRVLNDALILLSAAKAGLTVLTRNSADYDLLLQLAPNTKAVFYGLEQN
jgi:predicted nucleic acid-binding protein